VAVFPHVITSTKPLCVTYILLVSPILVAFAPPLCPTLKREAASHETLEPAGIEFAQVCCVLPIATLWRSFRLLFFTHRLLFSIHPLRVAARFEPVAVEFSQLYVWSFLLSLQ
jgi:hypothetical protein